MIDKDLEWTLTVFSLERSSTGPKAGWDFHGWFDNFFG